MLFYDTTLLPYSPVESLLNPLSVLWHWLFPTNSSQTVSYDGIAGIEPVAPITMVTPKEK
ncbi:hypothetical protein BDV26DRAFT_276822 [Aspergillus bertholletiae]|uniref:Uncharacterized protein n=1 Tax=Aspergillus bertholletiae TaxID=1226010 RepID=A0A5N7AML9_9EURO|nr:hypothetical protein BDV26DRAFT_276822 [Aspergillus bertholletiae]